MPAPKLVTLTSAHSQHEFLMHQNGAEEQDIVPGSSRAGKWPPAGISVYCCTFQVCSIQARGIEENVSAGNLTIAVGT